MKNKLYVTQHECEIGLVEIVRQLRKNNSVYVSAALIRNDIGAWTGRYILPKSVQKQTSSTILKKLCDFETGRSQILK